MVELVDCVQQTVAACGFGEFFLYTENDKFIPAFKGQDRENRSGNYQIIALGASELPRVSFVFLDGDERCIAFPRAIVEPILTTSTIGTGYVDPRPGLLVVKPEVAAEQDSVFLVGQSHDGGSYGTFNLETGRARRFDYGGFTISKWRVWRNEADRGDPKAQPLFTFEA